MLIASFATNLLGILVFLFIFWKRLKEDYSSEIIFKTAFYVLTVTLLGYIISFRFMPSAYFWASIASGLIGLGISFYILKVRFYETLEALVIGTLPWMSLIFLLDSVTHSSFSSFLAFIGILIFVFISYYLDAHYKNFTWYKSGRIGFAGIATLALFFLTRSILAIFNLSVISFLSLKAEAIISGAAAFVCFILIFNLAKGEK